MKIEVAFWDTSAIVPICCRQPSSRALRQLARQCRTIVAWWGTPVETRSAFDRQFRQRTISERELAQAHANMQRLRESWLEIGPSDQLRDLAEELPGKYGLRALDSFQLAAALLWCKELPKNRVFVCPDVRLATAAEQAGFTVLG